MANNFAEAMQQGYAFGSQQRQEREQRNRLAELEGISSKVISGDLDATSRAYALDPNQAKTLQGEGDRQRRQMIGAAKYMKGAIDSGRPGAAEGAWSRTVRPFLIRAGYATEDQLSPNWQNEYGDTLDQVLATEGAGLGGGGGQGGSQNKVVGDALVDANGNIIYQAERQPEYMWSDRAGAWIPNPNNALISQRQGHAQGTPANPLEQGGTQAQVDADAALANEMIAAGISDAQVDAFLAARMNPNGGSAGAASSGSLEPVRVAGVGPKPEISAAEQIRLDMAREAGARADRAEARADRNEQRQVAANSVSGRTPNEGERNASGFYQRMVAANAELKRLTDAGYDPTNLRDHLTVGSAVGNYLASNEGQQYNQAAMNWVRANLRKESGAAIGVDEARQEIRNYFPQPGDSPEVVQQKAKNRLVVEQAMLQAAGRAAPQRGPAPSNAGGWSIQRIE